MKIKTFLILGSLIFLLSGCASFLAGGDVQVGREDFIIGNNKDALAYFEKAAKEDPEYVTGFDLPEGIWSYVGRAEYANGKLSAAGRSLERALANHRDDNMARLYLGLTLARAGDRQSGLKDIDAGLEGIENWIDYVHDAFRFSYGQYWDPRREIRSEINSDLTKIARNDFKWRKLIASGEWIGRKVEDEIDLARRDESQAMDRDDDNGDWSDSGA
jgi:tetratricopeptide (TPR) repeat protein